jgi:hypothetical protein
MMSGAQFLRPPTRFDTLGPASTSASRGRVSTWRTELTGYRSCIIRISLLPRQNGEILFFVYIIQMPEK